MYESHPLLKFMLLTKITELVSCLILGTCATNERQFKNMNPENAQISGLSRMLLSFIRRDWKTKRKEYPKDKTLRKCNV